MEKGKEELVKIELDLEVMQYIIQESIDTRKDVNTLINEKLSQMVELHKKDPEKFEEIIKGEKDG